MHADLERLIALQQLDSAGERARRRLAEEPEQQRTLDERLELAGRRVETAKERLAVSQESRRAVEKELSVHQGRLSKFRDQLMEVKTNVEYQAMQKEMGFAQAEVKALEDRVLEHMLAADDLAAEIKQAEGTLATERKHVDADRRAFEQELEHLRRTLERIGRDREALIGTLAPGLLATYDLVASRRHGVVVAEAKDGVCTLCHVRLRPQVFNTILRNTELIQCESCQRFLYHKAPKPEVTDAAASPPL